MNYEGIVYRPPSEANSLIIQVTIGCSHNECTFCNMYRGKKFRVKDIDSIIKELKNYRKYHNKVKRIFLADGDALVMKTKDLVRILDTIKEIYPECTRVSAYATPNDIIRKSDKDLRLLKSKGLALLYMGVESGSDEILESINKGVTSLEMIKAGKKIVSKDIKLSVTVISGIGGVAKSEIHAIETARVISEINPDYLGLLTLMVEKGTEFEELIYINEISLLSPLEVMKETYTMIENIEVENCMFRSNHASNYIPLAGVLGRDKEGILNVIKNAKEFRTEGNRGL